MTDATTILGTLAASARGIAELAEMAATYRDDGAPATAHARVAKARAEAERLALDLSAVEAVLAAEAEARAKRFAA